MKLLYVCGLHKHVLILFYEKLLQKKTVALS